MSPSGWLTAFLCLILTVTVPSFIINARSTVRATRRLRQAPDDRVARFESGWDGTFALLNGLASCLGLAGLLGLLGGTSGLALAGLIVVNLLVQPVALLFCWVGVRKVALGLFGHVVYAGRRVSESELASLPASARRWSPWFCVFQGIVALAIGAAMSVSCAGLFAQSVRAWL